MENLLEINTNKCGLYKPYFDKETTNIIKGIALILMFVLHFFMFPGWWVDGIKYPFIEKIAFYLYRPARLCVPVFCFLTGYFYFFNPHKTFIYSLKKITDLLVAYWFVFFLLALIAVCFVKYGYKPIPSIMEMFALERPRMPTIFFGWYVSFYYFFMLLMPIIAKILSKEIHTDILLSVIGVPIVLQFILFLLNDHLYILKILIEDMSAWFPNVLIGFVFVIEDMSAWFPYVLSGFVVAKHNLFAKMDECWGRFKHNMFMDVLISLMMVFLVPFGRYIWPGMTLTLDVMPQIHSRLSFYFSLDTVYVILFMYFLIRIWNVIKNKKIRSLVSSIGKYSLLMWFIHGCFFANCKHMFQPILYFPRNPILVTLWGLFLCYLCALPINVIVQQINSIKNRLIFGQRKQQKETG